MVIIGLAIVAVMIFYSSQRSPVKETQCQALWHLFPQVKFDFPGSSILLTAQFIFCTPGGNKHIMSCVSEDFFQEAPTQHPVWRGKVFLWLGFKFKYHLQIKRSKVGWIKEKKYFKKKKTVKEIRRDWNMWTHTQVNTHTNSPCNITLSRAKLLGWGAPMASL